MRGADNELAVNSRSMLQIMGASRASWTCRPSTSRTQRTPSFEDASCRAPASAGAIQSGKEKPAAAHAAVQYRDHWFWIDDGDSQTKRALTAVMFFFTIADTGGTERLPLITIPAQ